jgi:hypothetical protein
MKDLTSSSPQKVKAALERAKTQGDATWILPLLQAFASRPEDGLREEMGTMLGTLKLSAAEDIFLDALVQEDLKHIRAEVLGFLWSCGFTCEGRLAAVTEAACEGDFHQALEGVTLIEQVETITHEKDVLEAMVIASEALKDAEKETIRPFVQAMAHHLALLNETLG